MAADLANAQAELVGTIPKLSALHASGLVNRAWGRIRDYRLWSFQLVSDAQLVVPVAITAGRVSAVNGSATVTTDAVAGPALNAVATAFPPLAGILGQGRQLRLGSTTGAAPSTGPNYTILTWAYNGGTQIGTITLDKPFGEASTTASVYEVLKCYYNAPNLPFVAGSSDRSFIKFTSITNRQAGYSWSGKNLNWSQEQLNQIDPQRGGQGNPYIQANYSRGSTGGPVFELYPAPVSQVTLSCAYLTRWPDLSPTQDLPVMPYALSDCVVNLAKVYAAQWAMVNVATFPESLGQVNWVAYQMALKAEAKESLQMAIKLDDEVMPWGMLRQGGNFSFPLGGAFLQGHDLSSLFPS